MTKPKGCKYGYEYVVVFEPRAMDNQESYIDHYILSYCQAGIYEKPLIGWGALQTRGSLCDLYDWLMTMPRGAVRF